jgi:hypothetical protein
MWRTTPAKVRSISRRFRSRISRSVFIPSPVAQLQRSRSNEPQRFCAAYRKAGGDIALEYIDADRHAGRSPDRSQTGDMFARMVEFIGKHFQ